MDRRKDKGKQDRENHKKENMMKQNGKVKENREKEGGEWKQNMNIGGKMTVAAGGGGIRWRKSCDKFKCHRFLVPIKYFPQLLEHHSSQPSVA